jgi:ABC-2 type transport system ATP-binding protein
VTIPILSTHRLSLYRGRRCVYDDLSFSLYEGVTVLLGPNGAGKTTLLDALVAPDRVRRGQVLLDDEVVEGGKQLQTYHSRLGYMPQHWQYFSGFTAQESVEYAAWLKNVPSRRIRAAASQALSLVGLTEQGKDRVSRMSGGMRQRVGLAEALVNDPRIVLLDEPTVGLDPAQRATFREALRSRAKGRAILLSTHLTDDAQAIADRVLVVDKGHILFDGTPASLAALATDPSAPTPLEAGYLALVAEDSEVQVN